MSPNPIEALGEIIGKINYACDKKHGWIKDREVADWLVDNIANRIVVVQNQIGNSAGEPDSGCAGTEEKVEAQRPAECPAKDKPCPMTMPENKGMAPGKLEERVAEIVCEQLGVLREQVVPEASFVDDLWADSLDCVELVMAMEEEFGITVPQEDAEKLTTVGKALEYLRSKGF